jgi:hypothetical protein
VKYLTGVLLPGEVMVYGGLEFKGDDMVENAKVEIPVLRVSDLNDGEQNLWDEVVKSELYRGTEEALKAAGEVIVARRRGLVAVGK